MIYIIYNYVFNNMIPVSEELTGIDTFCKNVGGGLLSIAENCVNKNIAQRWCKLVLSKAIGIEQPSLVLVILWPLCHN